MKENAKELFIIILIAWLPLSWVTHILVCLSDDRLGFLIAGAIVFPIAVIHGTGVWFGLF